jgi:fucose permease
MEKMNSSIVRALPVLFGFLVMGFVDVVGISTSYAQADFKLSETLAGFIPSMVFFWFLLLGIPTALLLNRIGRKRTVQLSYLVTIVGMCIPFVSYDFTTSIAAFCLLGIGNTILQVSLNPLLTNVVRGEALTSSLTTGQVVKAVSSFLGPVIAAFAVRQFGNWQYIFPIFAGITLLSSLWLLATPIREEAPERAASVSQAFGLLKDRTILLCFLGIVFVVGIDVGMNTVTPKLLMERAGTALADAGLGSSVYFLCRTAGALTGAVLLARMADMKYYKIHIAIALAALAALYFTRTGASILAAVGVTGFACSSLFPVVFSQAIQARPEKANEISGLMITGVFGGAVIPPLMGAATEAAGSQTGSLIVITACALYMALFCVLVKPAK